MDLKIGEDEPSKDDNVDDDVTEWPVFASQSVARFASQKTWLMIVQFALANHNRTSSMIIAICHGIRKVP